jgi:hypothetical protein
MLAAVALTCVRTLAQIDLPLAAFLQESFLTATIRARGTLSRILKADG